MVILDTNVISELTRRSPNPSVMSWVDAQKASDLYLTAISKAEILYGVNCMPQGRKRAGLLERYAVLFDELFEGRILAFDGASAEMFAELATTTFKSGQNRSTEDLQIAAISRQHGFAICTRNVSNFQYKDIQVIDPWTG